MKAQQIYLLLLLFVSTSVDTFNPLSYFYESCDSNWISFNATGKKNLWVDLKTVVFHSSI